MELLQADKISQLSIYGDEPDSNPERHRIVIYPTESELKLTVYLTSKSLLYLVKLAHSAVVSDAQGWIYKDDIELGFNQARYLYRMSQELKSGGIDGSSLIENNRLGYYRLTLPKDRIVFHLEYLTKHWDCRIADVFDAQRAPQAAEPGIST